MAFTKRDVKDRVVQYPRRYQLVEVQSGIFDLIPVTGTVTEPGTAINKAYLQPIEEAIEDIEDGTTVVQNAYSANNAVISQRATKLDTPRNINGVPFDGSQNIAIVDGTKAPISHANAGNTYGLGSPTLHGHVKTINALTQASHVDGTALSAYQGKLIKDLIDAITAKLTITRGNVVFTDTIAANSTITKTIPIGAGKTRATIYFKKNDASVLTVGFVKITDLTHAYSQSSEGSIKYSDYGTSPLLTGNNNMFGVQLVDLTQSYISGNNLVLVFRNSFGDESRTLNCKILWEVQ